MSASAPIMQTAPVPNIGIPLHLYVEFKYPNPADFMADAVRIDKESKSFVWYDNSLNFFFSEKDIARFFDFTKRTLISSLSLAFGECPSVVKDASSLNDIAEFIAANRKGN